MGGDAKDEAEVEAEAGTEGGCGGCVGGRKSADYFDLSSEPPRPI